MYYIKNGLKKHWLWLAYLFSAFGVLTVFGTGNATQVNTITTAIDSALYNFNLLSEESAPTLNLVIGIVLAALIALILIGGIKRIGQVTEKLVPFMAIIYILLAIGVVLINFRSIPAVFGSIFEGAFNPAAVTGGAVGSFFMSMKKGGHDRDLYTDRTGHFMQRRSGWIWRGSRCRAYHQRIHLRIWWLGIYFYCGCNVLFCILHDHWLGTLRNKMY